LDVVRTITGSVGIPVSADVESGYGLEPDELVTRLLEAGAVGANIEDVVHGEGDRVRERREHADYIAGARRAADEAGVPFVINGRTDAVKLGSDVFADPLGEAAERIALMEKAGARSVYPVGLSTADQVTRLVQAVSVPLNVTAHPVNGHGAGDVSALRVMGVRRVAFGPLWQQWLGEVSAEALSAWREVGRWPAWRAAAGRTCPSGRPRRGVSPPRARRAGRWSQPRSSRAGPIAGGYPSR